MAAVSPPSRQRSTSRSKRCKDGAEQPSSAELLVAAIIQLLEAGTTPWRRVWDSTGGGHHVNLLSGHRYRGANPILLTLGMHLRGSVMPYWCGFAEAKAHGVFPRQGSRGIRILRPQLICPGDAAGSVGSVGSGGQDPPKATTSRPADGSSAERGWVSFRPVVVFNASDLQGEKLAARRSAEQVAPRSEPERLAAAETILSAWPVPVSHGGDKACYLPQLDRIQLPERAAFHSAAGFYATWAHEAIHSTGHASRLKRDLGGRMGSKAYAREELIAELGSVLLGDQLEIGSAIENHAAYLGHWVELLKESPQVLFQVLGEARRAVEVSVPHHQLD
ncbi:ArdC family protein [Synechococcus sp. CS-1324]|uniref:ArdC family protein n=1 Tax=Synechococcus sp. CS-1324 TaxID=2847980 RepID=UPI00223BF34B|nr:zincin-like metallopeptidase domain-containing protein [Synechococcus sp. CS-1324]